jgi:hypothetical protein
MQPTIFEDFGVPLYLIGSDIPSHLRELAPIGLNWISVQAPPSEPVQEATAYSGAPDNQPSTNAEPISPFRPPKANRT